MNKCLFIGRLTKDPELKYLPGTGTAVATFNIAVDRRMPNKDGKREADFIPVVVWGKQAESCATYTAKGKLIGIFGRLQVRSYDAKDGVKKIISEIVAEEVQFIEWSKKADTSTPPSIEDDMTPVDGELPF
jgi:single-strand DNA-binding protein